jgi:hypothetical protein
VAGDRVLRQSKRRVRNKRGLPIAAHRLDY